MKTSRNPWALALYGNFILAIGMGLGRFLFTPLLPAMLDERWITLEQGGWLASINYFGYLAGSILLSGIHPGDTRAFRRWIHAGLVLTVLLLVAMGLGLPFWLACVVRFGAGMASAVLLVFGSMYLLSMSSAPKVRAALFGGVGSGILLSGEFSQWLLHHGFSAAAVWMLCGLLALLLGLYVWFMRFEQAAPAAATSAAPVQVLPESFWLVLVLAYGLVGYGYIINATYMPVFVKSLISDPLIVGHVWSLVGLTALPSCFVWVWLGQRYGNLPVLIWNMVIQAVGVALIALWPTPLGVLLSAASLGGTFMGTTALALPLGRSVTHPRRINIVALLTALYGVGQIGGPLAAVWLHKTFSSFTPAILSAALALLIGAAMLWTASMRPAPKLARH